MTGNSSPHPVIVPAMTTTDSQGIRCALLRWFDRHRRPMPWRNDPHPYKVWISEIMLQQTQVATVIPYFERFITRFPAIGDLAAANLQAVLEIWQGLGYYSRARNLHKAARIVMNERGGELPRTAGDWQTLPGIGPYAAGAIASICHNEVVPAVDGNVVRVFTRLLGIQKDSTKPAVRRELTETVATVIAPHRAGDFNQAIMELGALVCKPRNPNCAHCPLRRRCVARAEGLTATIPVRPSRKPVPHIDVAACVIRRGNRLLIARRRPDQMLGGLWEFPGGKQEPDETLEQTAIREIAEEIGIEIRVVRKLGAIKHAFSHFKMTLHVFECRPQRGRARAVTVDAVKWVGIDELNAYPFPAADQKIIRWLTAPPAE
ncbi:MAG: A/G-specific adenine glycosylase [Kiritimatiellia bacterium]|jgi:A/G-specific adenine glycosylase|nr:A/G-specific adenine glycosylase [Kiritimatiellia bacterium]MDP6629868.1 A/G-specific adenine glycosylase [Kiritimatiellia bacterium]MDP6809709.1 A/G-specific adenine glycosylase [Kiritimatiellia bacterium]